MNDYEKEYEDFWKDIVEKDGVVDMDQIKKELFDFSRVMQEVSIVYDNITNGRISKPNTKAFEVIAIYQELKDMEVEKLEKERDYWKLSFNKTCERQR